MLDTSAGYVHDADPDLPDSLRAALDASIAAQRALGTPQSFVPDTDPERHTSEAALQVAQQRERVPSDIRSDPALGNPIVFHTTGLVNSITDDEVTRRREVVDGLVAELLDARVDHFHGCRVVASGHFWYPPGAYQGWHTNERVPGWRAYVTRADAPGRSYFRYQDPASGAVVTSWDSGWDLRVFEAGAERHFWHAVASWTDRFSFGYRIVADG